MGISDKTFFQLNFFKEPGCLSFIEPFLCLMISYMAVDMTFKKQK